MNNNIKGTAVLTDEQVVELRKEYAEIMEQRERLLQRYIGLGKKYGISQDTMRKIVKNKTYKWVA